IRQKAASSLTLQQCLLHGLEKKGYLTSRHERTGRRERRVYDITEQGRTALADAKTKVKELFGELVEGG
ncbi:PadR family transcriptional regulator, partial [Shigella flexneri]